MGASIVAIDPGNTGALSFMTLGPPIRVDVVDMPTMEILVNKKSRHVIDGDGIARLIRERNPSAAIIENVHGMPGEGAVQSFSFGRGIGRIEGVLIALGVPRHYVTPMKWKRDLRMAKGKDAARLRATELMPVYAPIWARKKDDGRAEAALIGFWHLTQGMGT